MKKASLRIPAESIHHVASPFPRQTPSGKTITDELCTCGHLRSQHVDAGPAWGHGFCAACRPCQKYTWKSSLTDDRTAT